MLNTNKWVPIEELEITPQTQSIHIDTRDFHCLATEETSSTKIKGQKYPIPANQIREWLTTLEVMTGGKGGWRMMNFKGINADGWFKYIRLYRLDANSFIVCTRDGNPVDWHLMTENNLDKKHLYFH